MTVIPFSIQKPIPLCLKNPSRATKLLTLFSILLIGSGSVAHNIKHPITCPIKFFSPLPYLPINNIDFYPETKNKTELKTALCKIYLFWAFSMLLRHFLLSFTKQAVEKREKTFIPFNRHYTKQKKNVKQRCKTCWETNMEHCL